MYSIYIFNLEKDNYTLFLNMDLRKTDTSEPFHKPEPLNSFRKKTIL